ncbi:ribonuclease HII [Olleya sp. R77988]|uniref:ribonuclease HII n=1 Tax=Olleya sp. R77988 TaxID=3093875 RepID=UPI0037C804B4
MKHFWYNFLFVLLIFSCQSSSKKTTIEDFIYNESDFILSINNLENFKSNTSNNHFIAQLTKTDSYKNVTEKLSFLSQIKSNQHLYINLFKDSKDSLQYSFATKINDSIFTLDSIKTKQETLKLKGFNAKKITNNNQTIFVTKTGSIIFGSSSKAHLEDLFNSKPINISTKKIIATQDREASFSVFANKQNNFKQLFKNEAIASKKFTEFLTFDTEVTQNQLTLNGITKATDSAKSLINVFKNTLPQDNQLAQIAPSNSDGFLSITFNDFKVFRDNLKLYNPIDSISKNSDLFDNIIEFGEIYTNTTSAIVLNSIDVISSQEALLNQQESIETFRDIKIYNFENPKLFFDFLKPFIQLDNATKYCVINQFLVFADNTETLENIIVNYQNQTTFSHRDYYKDIQKNLSNQASILQVLNPDSLQKLVEDHLTSTYSLDFKDYKTSALQFVYDSNFAHFNAVIQQNTKAASDNTISELFNIKLDNDVLNNPQFVKNHRTRQQDIVVQDISNKLYLISNNGRILWKKQLNGPVLGKIEQIDMYKNGRLQLAFATPKRVYVLDRNGNDVKPFPMKFNDEITQPLSVFDYDKKKNYRLFVTQGKNVLLYDGKGKTVKGFNFKSAKEKLNTQPKHIRIGRKDYLVFKTDNQLYILDRRGKTRVKPKTSLSYSKQPVFNYNSDFITTTADGNLATITANGRVIVANTNLSNNNTLASTTKTLILQSDNILNIKDQTLELDFGNYTPAQLFYINNKIYITTTDLQTQKILLYDSNGQLLKNFPVYGTSSIDLSNIDKDSDLEFVTKGENNSVLVYKIN